MKKALKFMMLMGVALTLVVFASCDKDDDENTNSPVVTLTKATISGLVYANLNLTNDTMPITEDNLEKVPAGTVIDAVINVSDLIINPDPTINYGKKHYTTTVQSDGSYSIEVDASPNNIPVTLKFNDFIYNQVIDSAETKRTIFQAADISSTVTNNVNQIVDVYYAY